MNKYIFLTFSIGGLSGGPSYVNNKINYLYEQGYDVIVFDHGGINRKTEVKLGNLVRFANNRLIELFFPPAYYSKRQRSKILAHLTKTIGSADDYIVESNSSRLALWGELLARRLNAKHLIFEISEQLDIRSQNELDFYDFKISRNEWFCISSRAAKLKFSRWRQLTDDEASACKFSAYSGVHLEDVPMPELGNLPDADYRILSFGRRKQYFINMIEGVLKFALQYPGKKINLVFMGDLVLTMREKDMLNKAHNLFYFIVPPKRPIPRAIFDYSDVVIATSGCATISYRERYKTISMNVETGQPLGVMGYTTQNSTFNSIDNNGSDDLCTILDNVIVKHLYDKVDIIERPYSNKGFSYQISLINDDRVYWPNIENIPQDISKWKQILETVVLRCGGTKFLNKLIVFHS